MSEIPTAVAPGKVLEFCGVHTDPARISGTWLKAFKGVSADRETDRRTLPNVDLLSPCYGVDKDYIMVCHSLFPCAHILGSHGR